MGILAIRERKKGEREIERRRKKKDKGKEKRKGRRKKKRDRGRGRKGIRRRNTPKKDERWTSPTLSPATSSPGHSPSIPHHFTEASRSPPYPVLLLLAPLTFSRTWGSEGRA